MKKIWTDEAWEDYLSWHEKDKNTLKKIHKILQDIDRNGYNCSGKCERLKYELSDYWSVRIDEKNRLVFRIVGDCIEIYQCATHYGDK